MKKSAADRILAELKAERQKIDDTIARLDDYIVTYAARFLAEKDKNWDHYDRLTARLSELKAEVETLGRNRDLNSPGRIVDISQRDRWGRVRRYR